MPFPLEINNADDSVEKLTIPAEIWRWNNQQISKLFITDKEIAKMTLDPHLEIADADRSNNQFPREAVKSRFKLYEVKENSNPMLRDKVDGGGSW